MGLLSMMLMLAVLYDIPELNLGFHFYLKSDGEEGERTSLRSSMEGGPKYTKQVDDEPRPPAPPQPPPRPPFTRGESSISASSSNPPPQP